MTDKFEQSRICEPAFVQHGIHSENSLFFYESVLIYRMYNNTRLVSGLICGSNCARATRLQRQAIRRGERVQTLFAIEILSDSEKHEDVLDKIAERGPQDYFDGGAQLVWYIIPKQQKIYAYTSPDDSTVFKGQQTITAAPVIADFQFIVADLFA